MKKQIIVDTDVIVDFLRGYAKAVSYVENHSAEIVLSSIVVAELYAGVRDDERARLDDFVSLFPVLPITSEIAKAGGLFKRDYHKSYGIGLADALMAATAVAENAELKTLNTKHYPMLKGLKAPYIKR
ncbi:MAG: type II toxin-antitoxin system VapC family toxin [Desulfobacteria bacterium]|jgi:predicted nucleic acid-binding protein